MSAQESSYEDEPTLDPVTHRIFLMQEMADTIQAKSDEAAVMVSDGLDCAVVLSGKIAPYKNDAREYYTNSYVTLVLCFNGIVTYMSQSIGYRLVRTDYPIALTEQQKDSLNPATGRHDSDNRFMLDRTTFTAEYSRQALNLLRYGLEAQTRDIKVRLDAISGATLPSYKKPG